MPPSEVRSPRSLSLPTTAPAALSRTRGGDPWGRPLNSSVHNIVSEGATSTRSSLGGKSPGSRTRLESMRHRRPRPTTDAAPLRTPNCSNRADTCNHRPSAVASANAYRQPGHQHYRRVRPHLLATRRRLGLGFDLIGLNDHEALVDRAGLVLVRPGTPAHTRENPSLSTRQRSVPTRLGLPPSRRMAGRHRRALAQRRGRLRRARARPTGLPTLRPRPRGHARVARQPVCSPSRCTMSMTVLRPSRLSSPADWQTSRNSFPRIDCSSDHRPRPGDSR